MRERAFSGASWDGLVMPYGIIDVDWERVRHAWHISPVCIGCPGVYGSTVGVAQYSCTVPCKFLYSFV